MFGRATDTLGIGPHSSVVFCNISCGSSVAATRSLFVVLFRVILRATKVSCSFVPPSLQILPDDATDNVASKVTAYRT